MEGLGLRVSLMSQLAPGVAWRMSLCTSILTMKYVCLLTFCSLSHYVTYHDHPHSQHAPHIPPRLVSNHHIARSHIQQLTRMANRLRVINLQCHETFTQHPPFHFTIFLHACALTSPPYHLLPPYAHTFTFDFHLHTCSLPSSYLSLLTVYQVHARCKRSMAGMQIKTIE
jgi:hypothetical protein